VPLSFLNRADQLPLLREVLLQRGRLVHPSRIGPRCDPWAFPALTLRSPLPLPRDLAPTVQRGATCERAGARF
jgi:hypothetical protein